MLTQNDTASVVNSMNQTDNRGVLDQNSEKNSKKRKVQSNMKVKDSRRMRMILKA